MELFDKIYNCYYKVVQQILEEAATHPVTRQRMEELSVKYGFGESAYFIVPRLIDNQWELLEQVEKNSFLSKVKPVRLPITKLLRSWLKALITDHRIQCFLSEAELREVRKELADTDPLFTQQDFHYFDRCLDADPYTSSTYQKNFHTVLTAMEQGHTLIVAYRGRQGNVSVHEVAPYQLQYSGKDDKFRLCCLKLQGKKFCLNSTMNISRIEDCHLSHREIPEDAAKRSFTPIAESQEPILLEISGERNSLERCMVHFANYEKHTQYEEERGVYLCSIYYDLADETELLIDILSFGPVVRVLGPEPFLHQIQQRVKRQHDLFYNRLD